MLFIHISFPNLKHLFYGLTEKIVGSALSGVIMSNEVPPGYDQFWTSSAPQLNLNSLLEPETKPGQPPARVLSPELSDGQISITLDSDLMSLLDNITQELSRTSTAATARTLTSGSEGGSKLFDHSASFNDQFGYYAVPAASNPFAVRTTSAVHSKPSFLSLLEPTIEEPFPGAPGFPQPYGARSRMSRPSLQRPVASRTVTSSSDVDPLPQVLHALDDEPDDCIVVVRRITRLGFKSNRIIKTRFEQLGWDVKNVVLLPSRSRPADGGMDAPHARPSSMGFVVFSSTKSALECLARGAINVDGVEVLVQPFTRQYKPSISTRDTT
jgi:hypothetical protein